MKRLIFMAAAVLTLAFFSASPVLAEEAPDSWVKGLWLKATGLPEGAFLEDMSQEDDEPYFLYSFGEGADGPAVVICVGRFPQDEVAAGIFALDKNALAEFEGVETFFEMAKNLQFTEAEKFSEKFTYPCQIATFTNSEMGLNHTILFIQTDTCMFSVNVVRTGEGNYSDADVERWLMGLEMVTQ